MTENVLNIRETADYLRIPTSSAYILAQSGRIPARKVGKHWRILKTELDRYLANGANDEQGSESP